MAGSHDRVWVYRADARVALRSLQAGSISILLTDPPYQTVSRTGSGGYLHLWFKASLSWAVIGGVLALARRRLRADGLAFVMTNGDGLAEAMTAIQQAGFIRVRVITWDKKVPGLGGGLRHRTEYVLVGLLPGSRTLQGEDLVAVTSVGPGTAGRYPTQKPEGLGRALARIASIGPGDVVLDPFCGSGSLLVGAQARGATVIGCDVAPAAIRAATARLGAGQTRPAIAHRPSAQARAPSSLEGRRRPAEPTYRNSARGSARSTRRRPR